MSEKTMKKKVKKPTTDEAPKKAKSLKTKVAKPSKEESAEKKSKKSKDEEKEAKPFKNTAKTGAVGFFPADAIIARIEDNQRTVYDEEYIKGLAEDLAIRGLLEPVGLTIVDSDSLSEADRELLGEEGDLPEKVGVIRYGFQRWQAIQYLAEHNEKAYDKHFGEGVPYVQRMGNEENKVEAIFDNLRENMGRKDLTPAELAESFHKLRTDHGLSTDQIASQVGKSKGYVAMLVNLKKKLSPDAWGAFYEGKLTFDAARLVVMAEDPAKALKAALKSAEKSEEEGLQTKRGQKDAIKEAGGSGRPSAKMVKEKLEELGEVDSPNLFQQGVTEALRWVAGDRKHFPKDVKKKKAK